MNSTDKNMEVVFWVYEKWKFGEAAEDCEFEFFADEKGAKAYLKRHLQERKDSNFFNGLLEDSLRDIEEDDDYFSLHYEGPFLTCDYELFVESFDVNPAEEGNVDDA